MTAALTPTQRYVLDRLLAAEDASRLVSPAGYALIALWSPLGDRSESVLTAAVKCDVAIAQLRVRGFIRLSAGRRWTVTDEGLRALDNDGGTT